MLPAGDTIRIGGKIKNLSNTHKILIGPLYPELSGNAGAQSLTWNSTGSDPNDFEIPEHPQYLEPGEEKEFTVRITTMASDPRHSGDPKPHGGTRANLTFTPWGIATAADGEETIVDADRIKSDASDLELTIHIDDGVAVPKTDYLALAGGLMVGSAEAAGEMAAGIMYGIVELVKLPYTVIAGASTYQSRVWDSFTEKEKEAFVNDTGLMVASILLRNYDMGQEDFSTLWDNANTAVLNSMTDMANEWELGNHSDVARVYAKYGGQIIGEVAMPFAMAKIAKSAEAANALKRAQTALNAEMAPLLSRVDGAVSIERVNDILFTVKNGTEADLATLKKVMGYTQEEVAELQRIATKYGVLITSRSRQAESIRWVKQFFAKLKPEALKAKSVSPLDELLGYPTIFGGESPVGALVFKKPDALVHWEQKGGLFGDAINSFLSSKGINPTDPIWDEAVRRIILRADEWKNYEKTYKQWDDRGWIETTFTNEFNAIGKETWLNVNPKFKTQGAGKFEGFRLRKLHADGSPYETYVMEMFDGNSGKWRPVTGDIDNVAFTRTDSTALDEVTHALISKEVSESAILGARHGESATAREGVGGLDFIQKQFKPGEAAIQISPTAEAPRFVRLDVETGKSYWNDPRDYHLEWKGGFSDVGDTVRPTGTRQLLRGPDAPIAEVPAALTRPKTIPAPSPDGGPNVGRCDLRYSSADDAPAVIMSSEGKLVDIDSSGVITSSTLHDTCFSEGATVVFPIAPSTTLRESITSENLNARIEIYDDGTVASDGGPGGFEGGQTVLIGAGTQHSETRTINGFGSLIFDRPLAFEHEAGEVIVVIETSTELLDSDGDGFIDREDDLPGDPNEVLDTDGDGIGNKSDTDDDNDGTSDVDEISFKSDPLDALDTPENHRPTTPQISSITAKNTTTLNRYLLDLSAFSDPDEEGNPTEIEARITGAIGGNINAIIFEGPLLGTHPLTLPNELLDADTAYSLSIRYKDSTGLVSNFSETLQFATNSTNQIDLDGNGIEDNIEYNDNTDLNSNGVFDVDEGIVVINAANLNSAIGISTDSATLSKVANSDATTLPYASFSDFPFGLVGFRTEDLEPGQTIDVMFYLEEVLNDSLRWLQYNPNQTQNKGIIDLSEHATFEGNKVTVTYVDGGIGDLDGVVNGRIVGHSGPGTADCLLNNVANCIQASSSDSRCFVATALFGQNTRETQGLRTFRDKYLVTNQLGQTFVSWYYANSPAWVEWSEDKVVFRHIIHFLIVPIAELAALASGVKAEIPWLHLILTTIVISFFIVRRKKNLIFSNLLKPDNI